MPTFSVIIPTYNRIGFLKQAVRSVLDQTYRDYELIVVDDGSTDNTPSLVKSFGNCFSYVRQEHAGVSRARNTGIRHARAPFIAFLDSDDIWLPEKLQEGYRYICDHPEIAIHQTEEIWMRRGKRVNPMKKHQKRGGMIFIESLHQCMVSPSSVIMRRELFERFGLFDELLPACEDYELWLRITPEEPVGLIPRPLLVKHGGHRDQLSRRYWGMDRFRIYAIIKLLQSEISLPGDYAREARTVALTKSSILYEGALKRGRTDFADAMRAVIDGISRRSYNSINIGILLAG